MKPILTTLLLLLINFAALAQPITIGERHSINSKVYNDTREVLIYKPPSYYSNPDANFPVLYMVDADYNFHYVTGLIELLSGISEFIPEMIVVGVSGKGTTTYRENSKPPFDVKDKGNADVTVDYIEKELMPFIETNYKSNGYKILSGHSIGGLFVTYAMINHNHLFDSFIAISSSLWWEDEAVKVNTQESFKKKATLNASYYISLANEKGMGVHGFLEMIQYHGPRSMKIKFKYLPDESHGSVGLPTYKWALMDMFSGFRIEEKYLKDAAHVKQYHDELISSYKTTFHISTGFLRNTLYQYGKEVDKLLEIETAMAEFFPAQVDEYRSLVISHLIDSKKMTVAIEMLKRSTNSNSEYFETHANYAKYYQAKKDKVKATQSIKKAIKYAKQQQVRQWQMNELIEQEEMIIKIGLK